MHVQSPATRHPKFIALQMAATICAHYRLDFAAQVRTNAHAFTPQSLPKRFGQRGANIVIAGGIGERALANFAHHGIFVRAGTPGAPVEQLVMAYLNGQLTATPDGCSHHGHHHEHHHHQHGHDQEHGHAGMDEPSCQKNRQ